MHAGHILSCTCLLASALYPLCDDQRLCTCLLDVTEAGFDKAASAARAADVSANVLIEDDLERARQYAELQQVSFKSQLPPPVATCQMIVFFLVGKAKKLFADKYLDDPESLLLKHRQPFNVRTKNALLRALQKAGVIKNATDPRWESMTAEEAAKMLHDVELDAAGIHDTELRTAVELAAHISNGDSDAARQLVALIDMRSTQPWAVRPTIHNFDAQDLRSNQKYLIPKNSLVSDTSVKSSDKLWSWVVIKQLSIVGSVDIPLNQRFWIPTSFLGDDISGAGRSGDQPAAANAAK